MQRCNTNGWLAYLNSSILAFQWFFQKKVYPYKRIYKRLRHLIYRFHYEKYLKDVMWKFLCYPGDASKDNTDDFFGNLPRALRKIRADISEADYSEQQTYFRSARRFRSQFCKSVRLFRKLSPPQLCLLLNSHPEIARLDDTYPCFHFFYPFNPKFIETFENDIAKIPEYCSQGLLFGIGFPSEEFTNLVAKICKVESEYSDFQDWCFEYVNSKNRNLDIAVKPEKPKRRKSSNVIFLK